MLKNPRSFILCPQRRSSLARIFIPLSLIFPSLLYHNFVISFWSISDEATTIESISVVPCRKYKVPCFTPFRITLEHLQTCITPPSPLKLNHLLSKILKDIKFLVMCGTCLTSFSVHNLPS